MPLYHPGASYRACGVILTPISSTFWARPKISSGSWRGMRAKGNCSRPWMPSTANTARERCASCPPLLRNVMSVPGGCATRCSIWIERPICWYCARSSSARTSSTKEGPLSVPKKRAMWRADRTLLYPWCTSIPSGVMERDLEAWFNTSTAQQLARHSVAIPV
jgi:hypothetical protein